MYITANTSNHINTTASRKALARIVQGCVAKTTAFIVAGETYRKGALLTMVKKGYLDGWFFNTLKLAGTDTVIEVEIITPNEYGNGQTYGGSGNIYANRGYQKIG